MKAAILFALCALGAAAQTCTATGLGNGVVCVQAATGANTSSKPVSATFGATPTVGNKIILAYRITNTVSGPSCTDNQTPANTYTLDKQSVSQASNRVLIYSAPITTASGTFTVDCTQTGSITSHATLVTEVSGVTGVDTGINNSAGGTSTGSHGSGAATTSTAFSLLVSGEYMACTACTLTVGTSFTKVGQTASTSKTLMLQMRTVNTAGSYSAAFTDSQGFGDWISGFQAYQLPAGTGSLRRRGTWF